MKKVFFILITIFIFFTSFFSYAGEKDRARSLFSEGNTEYAKGNFEEAIKQYEEALKTGYVSGELYYNLGNAYFKDGFLGRAILNYLRADRLMPRDEDLNSNLLYAESLKKGGSIIIMDNWAKRFLMNLANSFSLNNLTLSAGLSYFIASFFIIFTILAKTKRRLLRRISYITGVVSLVLIVLFGIRFYTTRILKKAVIISERADAKFEPMEDATTFFMIEEGDVVTVASSKKDWAKIKRPDGKQGWVKTSSLELI